MSAYFTYRNNQVFRLQTPIDQFKQFKKDFNTITSDGYSTIYQAMPSESTIISKMRFEFEESPGFNVLTENAIGKMVFVHQEVVSSIANTSNPADLVCLVMTHPQAEHEGGYYEEIYIQFPYLKTPVNIMYEKLRPNLIKYFEQTDIHEQLEIIPSNTIDDIISGDIYKSGVWPMPGSYIAGNLLTITYVFDKVSVEQLRSGAVITGYTPESYLSEFEIPDKSEYDTSNSFYFADLNGFDVVKRKKTQKEKNRDVSAKLIEERQKEVKRTPIEQCKIFIDMLAPERYAIESSRNKVGQVLYNVSKGEEDGLELWKDSIRYKLEALNNSFPDAQTMAFQLGIPLDQFLRAREGSENPPPLRMDDDDIENTIKEIQNVSDEMWEYLELTECTIGTLRYWAKMDSPEQYKAFIQKDVMALAWKCLNADSSHTDDAKLIYAKYSDQVACAGIKDNVWFGYWDHRWHELDKCHHLRVKISEELPPLFDKILTECHTEFKKAYTDQDKDKWYTLMQACTKKKKDLKTVSYKNNLITECADRFYDPEFTKKLDEDRSLVGCPNGVYELATGLFRPGKPEDFITLSTKAKYNSNYNWDHPRVKEVVYYIKTVYPDRELRHYVCKVFGSILEGGNMNKDFYNMIGEGDNSKSGVARLLKLALGKYISKIPVAMIMGKRGNADGATPHLADKKGIRALFVEEPPKGQSNVSVVKELTGNDDILSRALFKMPIIFSPQWKLFVFTNHLLDAPAEEKAYYNRQKVIDHESLFSFDAPLSIEEQFATKTFPRDPLFDQKQLEMGEPALWCLFEWYKMFKKEGLIPPERVKHATNLAKLRNDIYLQYMRVSLDQGTQHDILTVEAMYEDFKTWHQNSALGKQLPSRMDFEEEMSKHGHLGMKPVDNRWYGVKLKQKVTQLPTFGGLPGMAAVPLVSTRNM